jgi:hypothetical protein
MHLLEQLPWIRKSRLNVSYANELLNTSTSFITHSVVYCSFDNYLLRTIVSGSNWRPKYLHQWPSKKTFLILDPWIISDFVNFFNSWQLGGSSWFPDGLSKVEIPCKLQKPSFISSQILRNSSMGTASMQISSKFFHS